MRIALLIFRYFPHGGLQRDLLAIAGLLRERGHAVEIFARVWDGPRPSGVAVHLVASGGFTNHGRDLSFARRAAAQARGFDLVVGFNRMPGTDVSYIADPCFVAVNRDRMAGLYRLAPRYRSNAALERHLFGRDGRTHIILLTGAQMRDYQRHYGTPAGRLHLVPPGIVRDRRRPDDAAQTRAQMRAHLGLGGGDLCFLFVAANFATKGLDRAIRAVADWPPSRRAGVKLVAIGSERAAPYRRLARRLGVSDNLQILPPREDVLPFMLAADLLVHPSRLDAAGMVILEAIVAGLPVVCTGLCGYAEHVELAGAGIVLAEPFSQAMLNAALAEAANPERLRNWSQNAAAYGRTADLYRGREAAAELIEALAPARGPHVTDAAGSTRDDDGSG